MTPLPSTKAAMPEPILHSNPRASNVLDARRRPFSVAIAGLLVAVSLAGGCSKAAASPDNAVTADNSVAQSAAKDAEPTDAASEICADMTRKNVALQISTGNVIGKPVLTKSGTVTTCIYTISNGSLRMTVDTQATDAAAHKAFDAVESAAGSTIRVPNLGTAAFTEPDGTTVTTLDDKVLTVDPSKLPDGNDKTQIAQSLSFEILNCWHG